MAEKVSLTKSSAKHADKIAQFLKEECGMDIVELKTYLYSKLVSDRYLILFASIDGEIEGLVECEVEDCNSLLLKDNIAVLRSVYVSESKRRSGIGKQLVETAKMWLKANSSGHSIAYPVTEEEVGKLFLVSVGYHVVDGIYSCKIK